jgi:hypothetical protein
MKTIISNDFERIRQYRITFRPTEKPEIKENSNKKKAAEEKKAETHFLSDVGRKRNRTQFENTSRFIYNYKEGCTQGVKTNLYIDYFFK